jgi:hypothetical protein
MSPVGGTTDELRALAAGEVTQLCGRLPDQALSAAALIIEAVRVIDYLTVFQPGPGAAESQSARELSILAWGWNRLVGLVLTPPLVAAGLPLMRSTLDTWEVATYLLRRAGLSILLERTADAVQYSFLTAEKCADGLYIRRASEDAGSLERDQSEFNLYEQFESDWTTHAGLSDWTAVSEESFDQVRDAIGAYYTRRSREFFPEFLLKDLLVKLRALMRPWITSQGRMVSYDTTPEIDDHFLVLALRAVDRWAEEAGLHPSARVGTLSGAELKASVVALVSLHLKHLHFCMAARPEDQVDIRQSLSIWTAHQDLVEAVAHLAHVNEEVAGHAIAIVSLRIRDASALRHCATPVAPLLIDFGNGMVLRPVSSVFRNPFVSIRLLQEWREPNARNDLVAPREAWLRDDIYALFQGNRYHRIPGSIKIRLAGRLVTDIDAAILDRTSGELALFQLKWQDYSTGDIRELRSKAQNLATEMETWAGKVISWLASVSAREVMQSLRLKFRSDLLVRGVYLFGISRSAAHTIGLGAAPNHPGLAVANWRQLCRVRMELGPVPGVIGELHRKLFEERPSPHVSVPQPYSFQSGGIHIHLEDVWRSSTVP